MVRYLRIILLAIFLLAVLLIVVLQFNSDRSIDQLISGNETLLEEIKVRNDLLQLQSGITDLESKVRGVVISGTIADNTVEKEFAAIHATISRLEVVREDPVIKPLFLGLQRQTEDELLFNREVLNTYSGSGKLAAEKLINTRMGSRLTDSIRYTTERIHSLHEHTVRQLIQSADINGERAKALGKIMAIIASIAAIFSFGYVSYKIRHQQQLIAKLNQSERKAREAAHIKENFLANMSHEIRTPMNAIIGFTDLLLQEKMEARSREYVETIHKSSENLLAIINDILDLSRIEAGMMNIDRVPFSPDDVMQTVEKMFIRKAEAKGVQLKVWKGVGIPEQLIGDSTRLTQILVNLIGNAIKFTDRGEVKLTVEGIDESDGHLTMNIEVTDTGIGIDRAKLPYIFERFRQADDEVNRHYGGTGLGLSIVKDLISLLGGTINVYSEVGKGTRFTVMIPYKISGERAVRIQEASLPHLKEPLALSILVAEDNSINQNLIRQLFGKWKVKYDMADNGTEVLEFLKQQRYDLVLMDIQMPGMDGYTTTRKIRETLGPDLPVIAMTAHALADERKKCLEGGMNDYISKPLRQQVLYDMLRKYSVNVGTDHFQLINLDYMKAISGGDIGYEELVTVQFIDALPKEIQQLEQAFIQGDTSQVKTIAHNLKTTVSVMGLNPALDPLLDALEYQQLPLHETRDHIDRLKEKCGIALVDAGKFYRQLQSGS